ncbi:hypothetical protein TcYC6_0029720 [Trypanosoma cruzi]|nr:hypothetical protein TcYC6_0029720 [Trypanosoma cruzi]
MGKVGVFTLLDEECAVEWERNKLSSQTYGEICTHKGQGVKRTLFYGLLGVLSITIFIIRHYAADVQYNVEGFLDKNRDTLKERMKHIFMQFEGGIDPRDHSKGEVKTNLKGTVGGLFIKQLLQLMAVINQTNPHWIRCVKPNAEKQCRQFLTVWCYSITVRRSIRNSSDKKGGLSHTFQVR